MKGLREGERREEKRREEERRGEERRGESRKDVFLTTCVKEEETERGRGRE